MLILVLVIDDNGNVSIGDTVPLDTVHIREAVNSATATQLLLQNEGAGNHAAGIAFQVSSSGETTGFAPKAGIIFERQLSNGRGSLKFFSDSADDANGFSAADEAMRIDSAGNVGIGADVPASRLHIGKAADTVETGMQFTNADGTGYVGMEGSSGNRFLGSSTNNMFVGTTGADGLEFATNNNVRMKVDSSGYVTKPNHPSFWAQTYNTYTYTTTGTIEFNSTNVGIAERYDNGGHYNATTGRFTAPVAGTYFFMLTCAASFSSNYLYLYILKNGSDIISRNYAQNSQYIENTLQVVTTLAVGDYVSCKTEKNATGGALYGPSFTGFLIH
jgi:hypothetical protein